MQRHILLLSAVFLLGLAACEEDQPVTPAKPKGLYTISGKLQFNVPVQVPPNARVLVGWNVSSGSPDYLYLFGEGKVNMADSTYAIVFEEEVPAEALNQGKMGVGAIILTTNQSIRTGQKYFDDDSINTGALGLATDHGVIFIKGSPDSATSVREWGREFKSGFNTGRGVSMQSGFDKFVPADSTGVRIVIDELGKLTWFNWT